MSQIVRGNRASILRSRIPRQVINTWPYTAAPSAPSASAAQKSRLPVVNKPVAPLKPLSSLGSLSPMETASSSKTASSLEPLSSFKPRVRSASCTGDPELSTMRTTIINCNHDSIAAGQSDEVAKQVQSGHNLEQLRVEQKKLEHMQDVFMCKLHSMVDQGQKPPGVYKFVVMAFNDERGLEQHNLNLPKNITIHSPSDENEKRLTAELAVRDQTIGELKKKLIQRKELITDQSLRLAESNASQMEKDKALMFLESELLSSKNSFNRLSCKFKETEKNLEQATQQVAKYLEKKTDLEAELKTLSQKHIQTLSSVTELNDKLKAATEAANSRSQAEGKLRQQLARISEELEGEQQLLAIRSDVITQLQQDERNIRLKYEDIYQEVCQKTTLINQLTNEIEAKNAEFRKLLLTLKERQDAVSRLQNTIKLLEEQATRHSLMRTKQEERSASMQMEITQLKQNMIHYVTVGNQSTRTMQQPPQSE